MTYNPQDTESKERLGQILRLWEATLKSYHDYKDQFYTKLMNGDVVKRATKIPCPVATGSFATGVGRNEMEQMKMLEIKERNLRRAWEKALL